MLVLSRKLGETIVIDEHIVVTVVAVQGDRIRLGITAPHDVPVYREELWNRIQAESAEHDLSLAEV